MTHRAQVLWLLVLLASLAGALVFLRSVRNDAPPDTAQTEPFTDLDHGVSFAYPTTYEPSVIDDQFKANGTIFRALDSHQSILTVRHETGLGVLRIGGGTVFDALTHNAERQLPRRFPGYAKQRGEERTVGAEQAYLLEFTYTGTDGQTTIRQLQAIVVVRDNDGYFFVLQAPETEFATRRPDFEALLASIIFAQPTALPSSPSS